MPRGSNPGEHRGGRKKGKANKSTIEAQEIMRRLGVDPIENMSLIADRRVSCGTCIDENRKPTGKTKYKLPENEHAAGCPGGPRSGCVCQGIGERTCLSCFGTLWERIPTETMLKASAELANYKHAKRKALEVTGADGGPIRHKVEVEFIPPNAHPVS